MSDIKTVQMNVPEPTKNKRSRKQKEAPQPDTIKKSLKAPLVVTNKTNEVIKPVKQAVVVSMNKSSLPYNESPLTPSPAKPVVKLLVKPEVKPVPKAVKIMPLKKPMAVTRKVEAPSKVVIIKNRPNKTIKNKFNERKIVINIDSSKIRKTRDAIRRKVANMPLDEVCKSLKTRGLIRETANPPEHIQRLMMIDILLFPAPM
jgi:hypothetical protein